VPAEVGVVWQQEDERVSTTVQKRRGTLQLTLLRVPVLLVLVPASSGGRIWSAAGKAPAAGHGCSPPFTRAISAGGQLKKKEMGGFQRW